MKKFSIPRRMAVCAKAVAAVEFAIILPVLLALLIGMLEITRYAIIYQKLDKTINTVTDLITRQDAIATCSLITLGQAAELVMEPYELGTDVTLIFTSSINFRNVTGVCNGSTGFCIDWQYAIGADASRIGTAGGVPVIPGGYTFDENQSVITSELFYAYEPLLEATGNILPFLAPHDIYRVTLYKPRFGGRIPLIISGTPGGC